MTHAATITSKMQFTIPMAIARKVGLGIGDRISVSEENGKILLTPMRQLIEELAGSVKIPKHLQGKDIDEAISQAKFTYFASKYSKKNK